MEIVISYLKNATNQDSLLSMHLCFQGKLKSKNIKLQLRWIEDIQNFIKELMFVWYTIQNMHCTKVVFLFCLIYKQWRNCQCFAEHGGGVKKFASTP